VLTLVPVLSQQGDQAFFLWGLRSRAVNAPHYDLTDLAKLDNRVEAHIDGLRIAGEEGWQLCLNELSWEEPGEIFAAAVLALESGNETKIQTVLKAATKSPDLARGFISALGWLDYQVAEPYIKQLCASDEPALRRIGIAGSAIHRKDPGRVLSNAIADPDPLLRARAIRAAGELGRTDLVPTLQSELRSKDDRCRFWAAWSIALLVGYSNAVETLQTFAETAGPFRERALHVALRRMDINSAGRWQRQLAANPKSARSAVIAAGIIGDPAFVPWLIEQMSNPPLARVAGEAFTMITGVDVAYEDLDADKPEGFESGPTEDPNDDNVEMDPDDRLPWPDADLIANWWEQHNAEFPPGIRHIVGKPITEEWLKQVLRTGRQRQRVGAALELAIMQRDQPLFEVRAPGFRQLQALSGAG